MGLQFFKGNKSLKGGACSLSFNSKEGALFVSVIKQTGYDETRHLGSFSGGDQTTVKFNVPEIGAFLDVLNNNRDYSTFHKTKEGNTSINFKPYFVMEGDAKVQKGFGLYIGKLGDDKKVSNSWLMPFNFGEAQVLKSYFDFVLRHIFSATYAEDKKKYQDRIDKLQSKKEITVPPPGEKEQEEI